MKNSNFKLIKRAITFLSELKVYWQLVEEMVEVILQIDKIEEPWMNYRSSIKLTLLSINISIFLSRALVFRI